MINSNLDRPSGGRIRPITGWKLVTTLFGLAGLLTGCGGGSGASDAGGGGTPPAATAPAITSQPQAQTVVTGQTATFSVTATGTAPLSYQWSKDGVAVSGATTSSYTTPATTAGDTGASFTVVISNTAGQVTSSGATLTANVPVAITSQPQSQTATTGDTATFNVTATGTAPLAYQWRKNGTDITGATSASYTTPAVTLADSGASFIVVVTNAAGPLTSAAATLSTNANPEGIYYGSVTPTAGDPPLSVFAIVLKNGSAAVFVTNEVPAVDVPVGYALHGVSVTPTGSEFSSPFTAYTQEGYAFSNGQHMISGTLSGTITPGVSITGTFASPVDAGTFSLSAATDDYARAASGAAIAGTYNQTHAILTTSVQLITGTATFDANGMAGPNPADSRGCTSSGDYTIPDATHNAYAVTNTVACAGPAIAPYTGLMALFPAETGAAIHGAAFTTDTIITIADNGDAAYMVLSSK